VWVEQLGIAGWRISLGQLTIAGPAYDWQVQLTFGSGPAGRTAELTTPGATTRDGTLLNKRAHGELRDLLTTGLSQTRMPAPSAEQAVSRQGLAASTHAPIALPDTGGRLTAVIGTTLTREELASCLALVPFPTRTSTLDKITWQLGDTGALADQSVDAAIGDDASKRTLRFDSQLHPAGKEFTDVFASQRARALVDAVFRAIAALDPGATRTSASRSDESEIA
jgi:hypothetical protein